MFRDELYGWLSLLERSDHAKDRAFYLEAFNAEGRYVQERVSRDRLEIINAAVSVFGGIQPARLATFLAERKKCSCDDGLFERLQLNVYPDFAEARYTDIENDESLHPPTYRHLFNWP
jgi:hypothetical protein